MAQAGWDCLQLQNEEYREGGGGVCIHYVYAALRPKSNEKAATITEYKTRAKQNRNRATRTTTSRTTTMRTTTSETTTSRTNALLIALLNGNS